MRLGIGTTGSFLYRNRANTSYPYDIGDLITIKTSTSPGGQINFIISTMI